MRIGIDIDNCISNFNDVLLEEYLKHDKVLRGTGIIKEKADYITKGMFDWSKEENDEFYYSNIERIAKSLKPLRNCKKMIDKLKEEGNEIYIISARDNGEYTNPLKMTKEWLEKYEIHYDKLILTDKDKKGPICKENCIDIMIEDTIKNCEDIEQNGVKCLLMNTRYNSQEKRFTPYHHENDISIEEGQEKSYQEVLKICKWLNFNTEDKVFKGSTGYLENGYDEINEAVNKIIEISNKNEKTYIVAIGAITNVALAIKKAPNIINKIEVIWLGGHSPYYKNNDEFNFKQDLQAVKDVFNSGAKITVIPCKGVASNLKISIYELEHHIKGKSKLCDYLCSRFYNDGIHGIQTRRVIWDISAIAYLINKEWFEEKKMSCPEINKDLSYEFKEDDKKINFVTYLDSDEIYKDLFEKLCEEELF